MPRPAVKIDVPLSDWEQNTSAWRGTIYRLTRETILVASNKTLRKWTDGLPPELEEPAAYAIEALVSSPGVSGGRGPGPDFGWSAENTPISSALFNEDFLHAAESRKHSTPIPGENRLDVFDRVLSPAWQYATHVDVIDGYELSHYLRNPAGSGLSRLVSERPESLPRILTVHVRAPDEDLPQHPPVVQDKLEDLLVRASEAKCDLTFKMYPTKGRNLAPFPHARTMQIALERGHLFVGMDSGFSDFLEDRSQQTIRLKELTSHDWRVDWVQIGRIANTVPPNRFSLEKSS